MSKAIRYFIEPATSGRGINLDLTVSDGKRIQFDIPASGRPCEDPEIIKILEAHSLRNHRIGFVIGPAENAKNRKVPMFNAEPAEVKLAPSTDSEQVKVIDVDVEAEPQAEPDADNDFDALPADTVFPYHFGGGNYYLSNGDKVKGKAKAQKAQKALNAAGVHGESKVTVIKAANINQLKDWLVANTEHEEANLATPSAIKEALNAIDGDVTVEGFDVESL